MKRVFILLLAFVMLLTLVACGGRKTEVSWPGSGTSNDSGSLKPNASGNSGGNNNNSSSGTELTDFTSEFTDALGTVSGRFEESLNSSDISPGRQLELINVTMIIGMIATYDLYGNALMEGMAKAVGGYCEKNGKVITFGEDYKREEDNVLSPSQATGDREVVIGKVDLASNTLTWESYTERDGEIISRTVLEGVLLKDNSVMLQYFSVGAPSTGTDAEGKAIFISTDAKNLEVLRATFALGASFKYNSIVGKNAMTAEDMASGYTLVWNIVSDTESASSMKY